MKIDRKEEAGNKLYEKQSMKTKKTIQSQKKLDMQY